MMTLDPRSTRIRVRAPVMPHSGMTRHQASPVTSAASGSRCLIPFDRREGLTTAEAAERVNRTERTIRLWCRDHDIGRRVAGGPWLVSSVALAMLLNDDAPALRAYLAGDRSSAAVSAYFAAEGISDLIARWQTCAA